MKTEIKTVTPALAREWLKCNTDNRPLRPGVVESFHIAYGRGEWKLTHQGIAFSRAGRLLDGQHRLTFISQLPEGTAVPMSVTTGQEEGTFDAIDQGFRRTPSDVLGVSTDLASVGRFFARVANAGQATGLSIQYVRPFVDWATPEFESLITFCPTRVLVWASAPVRSAAVYQMKRGHDVDFVQQAYHSLVHADIDNMPYAVRVLTQQHMSGKILSARSLDLFCRAMRAFDSLQTGRISKILVKDMSGTMAEVRAFILKEMKKSPAGAGRTVAKPARNSTLKRAA